MGGANRLRASGKTLAASQAQPQLRLFSRSVAIQVRDWSKAKVVTHCAARKIEHLDGGSQNKFLSLVLSDKFTTRARPARA